MSHFQFPGGKGSENVPKAVKNMIEKGQDPKEMMIEVCKPSCTYWHERLQKCEGLLEKIQAIDPEKSCMYPLRDWVTCVESCVQPKIQQNLVGNEPGVLFH